MCAILLQTPGQVVGLTRSLSKSSKQVHSTAVTAASDCADRWVHDGVRGAVRARQQQVLALPLQQGLELEPAQLPRGQQKFPRLLPWQLPVLLQPLTLPATTAAPER